VRREIPAFSPIRDINSPALGNEALHQGYTDVWPFAGNLFFSFLCLESILLSATSRARSSWSGDVVFLV
jgi:hypothetical protein